MQRRDLLKDQIEQAGKVLALALSKFLQQKSAGITLATKSFENTLQEELAIDLHYLKSLDRHDLIAYLESLHLNEQYLEKLALYFYEIAIETADQNEARTLLTKANELLSVELASESSFTFHSEPTHFEDNIIIDRFELASKIDISLKNLH
ncbi:MAG: hypothetical protein H6600_05895 [Flavobacteriales bacterium]|nr:hypothetical protein [Flavobacteriales bacterium]